MYSGDNCNVFYGVLLAMVTLFLVIIAILIPPRPAPTISLIEYERIYTCHIRFNNDMDGLIRCIEDKP